jgi:hypothetical protein
LRSCTLVWGANRTAHKVDVRDCDQLDEALDTIELAAILDSTAFQVDLHPRDLSAGDPILVQFLVGHPARSSLLWHEDGAGWVATMELSPLSQQICGRRPGGEIGLDPELTLVTEPVVRQAVTLYLMTNTRPSSLHWLEMEMD